jgi:DNA-binding GntR family transcriptional regulator
MSTRPARKAITVTLLYERISTHLLEEIRSGALGPGDRVASEMELAAQFEVSRITSKRALEVLREAGLVERIRGKGSFVVKRLPDLDGVTAPLKGALPPARTGWSCCSRSRSTARSTART